MWDLVGNPEDRFSYNEVHIATVVCCLDVIICFNIQDFKTTIKLLNFGTSENFAVINLKFKQRGQT